MQETFLQRHSLPRIAECGFPVVIDHVCYLAALACFSKDRYDPVMSFFLCKLIPPRQTLRKGCRCPSSGQLNPILVLSSGTAHFLIVKPMRPRCGVRRRRSIPAPATCRSLRGVHPPFVPGDKAPARWRQVLSLGWGEVTRPLLPPVTFEG
jgi:hypothetical protein